tara:strand:+ start:2868 stop:3734 length:867 start_codon:yes stop_codon:yes gene_type:complete
MNNKPSSSHRNIEPENSVLYIVGTPIGNLNDFSPRAINILKNVYLIACEDTRKTNKIMQKFEIKNKLTSFNKNNSYIKIPGIINALNEGKSIALVSDAGLPGICDPGEDLIKECIARKLNVICIPGPCAALTALITSGLPSSRFVFEGFLPRKESERKKILLEISKNEKTTIIYEAPHRMKKILNELKLFCGGSRQIHISRELTKKFEEHFHETIDSAINSFEGIEIIGEFTIVLKGINQIKPGFNKIDLKNELNDLIKAGLSLSAASKYLAKKNQLTKKFIYNLHRI